MLPYLKVLIRQRIAGWNPASYARAKESRIKTILRYFGFTLLALMLYGMLVALEYMLFWAFTQIGEPQTMLALTGVLCTLMVVLTSFFYIFSELFFSNDIAFVSALPISSRQLLGAKLIRIWLGEAGIALAICLPVIVLYGIEMSMGILYYLAALLLVPTMPMIPIAVVTILSFFLIRVSALWKRRESLTIILSMLFFVTFMWFEMQLSMSASGDDFGAAVLQLVLKQKSVLEMVAGLYPPIRWFCNALLFTGVDAWLYGLAFIAINGSAMLVAVFVLGGSYQKLAIQQSESLVRINATGKKGKLRKGVRTPLQALYRREVREIFTVPVYAMNSLVSAVMFPLLAVIMSLSTSSEMQEIKLLPVILATLPKALIIGVATALFSFTTSINMSVSTSVSREGKRHEFFRTLPVKPQTQLIAKLLMGITINAVCTVPMAITLMFLLPGLKMELLLGLVCSFLFSTVTTIIALMVDVNHPKFGWKTETEAIKQNGLAAVSMFASMLFFAACGGTVYGLTLLGVPLALAMLILLILALVMDGIMILHLMRKTSVRYIQQEVRL